MRNHAEKKLRVLHSAALLSPPSGILAQMDSEQAAAKTLGLDWQVRMYCPINSRNKAAVQYYDKAINALQIQTLMAKLLAWIKLRRNYNRWLLQQEDLFDIFMLRYYVHDPFQLLFVLRCKKPVYFVHHTLEVPELELQGGFSGFLRSTLEKWLGAITIKTGYGVIGVTQEIVDYEVSRNSCPEKPSFVYPNGIIVEELKLEDRRSLDVPELLFVANFAPWHGLDILLKNISESKEKFVLHLVGLIPDELIELTKDVRINVHGHLNKEQIRNLSAQCWVGLSSFALFRNKMKQACPLKVREYLMLGLPVYGDHQDFFSDVYFFKSESDNITEIIKYCNEVRKYKKSEILRMARKNIDKVQLLDLLYKKIKKQSLLMYK